MATINVIAEESVTVALKEATDTRLAAIGIATVVPDIVVAVLETTGAVASTTAVVVDIAVAIDIEGVVSRIAEAVVVGTIAEFTNFGIAREQLVAIIEVERIVAIATTAVVGSPGTIDSRSALAPVEARSP